MAVYTEVTDDDLEQFLAGYDAGELLSYKGIAEGVENTNYILHTTKGPFILTLYERRVARGDLPFFLGLMEHLSKKGVTCPLPVHDKSGAMLGTLAGKPAAYEVEVQEVRERAGQVLDRFASGRAPASATPSHPLDARLSLS